MLSEFRLAHFKAFSSEAKIGMRPITLIYGPNSSGKSSVLQSLLLLKQTLEESENPSSLLLPKGNLVDLGGYREFVHAHDISRPFSVTFRFPLDERSASAGSYGATASWLTVYKRLGGTPSSALTVRFEYDEKSSAAAIAAVELHVGDDSTPLATFSPDTKVDPTSLRLRGRVGYAVRLANMPRKDVVLSVSKLNRQHLYWRANWEATRHHVENELVPALSDRLAALEKKLDRFQDAESLPDDSDPRAKRRHRTAATSRKSIEADLSQMRDLLAKYSNYSFEAAIEEFEKVNRSTYLVCRNWLPADLTVPESRDSGNLLEVWDVVPTRVYFGSPLAPALAVTVATQFRRFLESSIYLGPLRTYPERHYVFSGNLTDEVGKTGKMVPDILYKSPELLQRVNEQMEAFGLGYELKVSAGSAAELQDVFALRLADRMSDVNVSIVDVGFGISQVLPIVVQSMLSHQKTLWIEQPEIHLHPRLQAELGSLLAHCIRKPYENRFVVETHSEHLIRRLQRLIRNRELTAEDVSVVFIQKDIGGSKALPLRLDAEGDFIDQWPGGFFEEGYLELFER